MANIVEVQFTAFQDLDDNGYAVGEVRYGYRIFDDYDAEYNNTFDSMEAMKEIGLTPEGIFDYIDKKHDSFCETVWERGVLLNNVYIKPPAKQPEDDDTI